METEVDYFTMITTDFDLNKIQEVTGYWQLGYKFDTKEEAVKKKNSLYKKIKRKGYSVTCDSKKKDNCDFYL